MQTFICTCNGVTQRQIEAAIQNGAASLRALQIQLGVASQCTRCADKVCEIMAEQAQPQNNKLGSSQRKP